MKAAAFYALLLWLCCPAFANEWKTIRGCRLMENESNDGDSASEPTRELGAGETEEKEEEKPALDTSDIMSNALESMGIQ